MGYTLGSQAVCAIADDGTAIGSFTQVIEVISESVRQVGTITDGTGIRATRSRHESQTRETATIVQGDITFYPNPAILDVILPYVCGVNESTDTFALGETLASHEFAFLVDRGEKRFLYDDLKVSRMVLTGSAGQLLQMTLSVIGKTETVSDTAFPSISASNAANAAPYQFSEVALTLVSSSREVNSFTLTIDNALTALQRNSLTPTDITEDDRLVTLQAQVPYSNANVDLYAQAKAGSAGSLVITNGNMSLTATFATLQVPDNSPVVVGRGEIPLDLDMTARMSSTTKEVEFTNDSTA